VEQACRKPATGKVTYRQGSAEALPLPNDCADLVFMSMVYHHLNHRKRCLGRTFWFGG